MPPARFPKYLLTGRPGAGKTTAMLAVARRAYPLAGGMVTEEIRSGNHRTGFRVRDLHTGATGVMAQVGRTGRPRVGRYVVDLETLEAIGVAALEQALERDGLILVDEIGKMELLSQRFAAVIDRLFGSEHPVLATIPQRRPASVVELEGRADAIIEVTESNRDQLPGRLANEMTKREAK